MVYFVSRFILIPFEVHAHNAHLKHQETHTPHQTIRISVNLVFYCFRVLCYIIMYV